MHLGRLRDKSRRVLSVSEVVGYEQGEVLLSVIYEFQETGERNGKVQGIWEKTGSLVHTEKLQQAGITL